MRIALVVALIVLYCKTVGYAVPVNTQDEPNDNNVFIITLDGLRWQEIFQGADSGLLHSDTYTENISDIKDRFWQNSVEQRRKKLMPFFWSVVEKNGQLFGNRSYGNKVNVSNIYALSYPGYNEIFTGKSDLFISSNRKRNNHNITLLEYLNGKPQFRGKVASVTSWDAFPFILNKDRSRLYVNCAGTPDSTQNRIPASLRKYFQLHRSHGHSSTRNDFLTYAAARDYIVQHRPRVLHLGLGGTDEWAHNRRYGQYLMQVHLADQIISWLWQQVQSIPFYRNKTTFIITTDHGRGNKAANWYKHGFFVSGSSQTWVALLGNGVKSLGEVKQKGQLYQKQLAGTIGHFLNMRSYNPHSMPVTFFE